MTTAQRKGNVPYKAIILLVLALVGVLLAVCGFVPAFVNFCLVPWKWFFDELLLKGQVDALANLPFFAGVGVTYRFSYLGLFWFVQTVQSLNTLLQLFNHRLSPARADLLRSLRNIAYGIELVINIWYGIANPFGDDDMFVVWRVLATLTYITMQIMLFEYAIKFIVGFIGIISGGLLDMRPSGNTKTVNSEVL